MVLLGLVLLVIQVVVPTDVTMVLGIIYLIAVHHHHLRLLLAQQVLLVIVFVAIEFIMVHPELVLLVTQEVVLIDVTMVLGIMYLIAVHHHHLRLLLVQQVLLVIVFVAIEFIMVHPELVLLDILEAVLTDVTMDHGSPNLILVVFQHQLVLAQVIGNIFFLVHLFLLVDALITVGRLDGLKIDSQYTVDQAVGYVIVQYWQQLDLF